MTELSVRECLGVGWSSFKKRPWIFIGAGVVLLIASAVADLPRAIVGNAHESGGWALGFLSFLISTGLSFFVSMGKTAFFLKAHDDPEAVELSDLWHPQPYWKYAAVSVLVGAAVILGLILLIVPGIILGIMFGFSLYIVIEKSASPFDAMRESASLTKGNRWNLLLLGLAILGINILGLLALIIGLFVSIPVSSLAVLHAYRVLSGTNRSAAPAVNTKVSA